MNQKLPDLPTSFSIRNPCLHLHLHFSRAASLQKEYCPEVAKNPAEPLTFALRLRSVAIVLGDLYVTFKVKPESGDGEDARVPALGEAVREVVSSLTLDEAVKIKENLKVIAEVIKVREMT